MFHKKRILSLNINGSSEVKIKNLKELVQQQDIYAVLLQEFKAKLIPDSILAAFPPENWRYCFSKFKIGESQGLLSLIRRTSDISVETERLSDTGLLLHRITLVTEAETFKFGNFYIRPSLDLSKKSYLELFETFIGSVECAYGDFNYNTNNRASILDNMLEKFQRIQLVDFPTFKKAGQSLRCDNLTDIIISKPEIFHQVIDTNLFIGDHVTIRDTIEIKYTKTETTEKSKPNHFYYDKEKITKDVKAKYWASLPESPKFTDLGKLTNQLLGVCRSRKKPDTNKISLEYFGGDEEPDVENPITRFWQEACQEMSSLYDIGSVFEAIKVFSDGMSFSEQKTSKFSRNQQNKALKKYKDRVACSKKLSHELNLKYARILRTVATRFRNKKPSFTFSKSQVLTELKKLNKDAKEGPDGFLPCFFPSLDDDTGMTKLTSLLNNLIFSNPAGIFLPHRLKMANLTFIPKNEDTAECRPLLLNSRILAIMDRLINTLVLKWINNSPRFTNRHAFRPFRGVENAFDEIINFIETAKKNNETVVLFQGDLANAYNGCHHKLIIIRFYELLHEQGLKHDHESSWVLLYLKNWADRYVYFENTSFRLMTGVPQGSPLSPSVFSVIFNWDSKASRDDELLIAVLTIFFADDLSWLIRGKDWEVMNRILNATLDDLDHWCQVNDFQLNAKKSKILIIGDARGSAKLSVQEKYSEIEVVGHLRVLGLIFDSKFTFSWHFYTIEKYMKTRIFALQKLRRLGLSERCLRAAALCLRSKLSFGLYHYMVMSKTLFSKFEHLWVEICRKWTGATQFVPIETMIRESGTCTLETFITYLLMSRSLRGAKLLPKAKLLPSTPYKTTLPTSPKIQIQKRSSNRPSTMLKTAQSKLKADNLALEKLEKNSEKFLARISDDDKEVFREVLNKYTIDKVKLKLKGALKVSFKSDARNRTKIFEEIKKGKIEKYKLEKYSA